MSELDQARLKELLCYDPETGVFTWRVSRGRVRAGVVAGTLDKDGYLRVQVDSCFYQAHRLAWFYMTGRWPADQIDHVNGLCADNKFVNLREVSDAQNKQNIGAARVDNRSGLLGVRASERTNKYTAQIRHNGKIKHLGTFATADAAHAAYREAKAQLHTHTDRLLGVAA